MDAVRVHLVAWEGVKKLWRLPKDAKKENLSVTAEELRLALRLLERE